MMVVRLSHISINIFCLRLARASRNDKEATEADRELPYEILCEAVTNREARLEAEKHFAEVLVRRIKVKAKLKSKLAAREGRLP
jgi:hypothetical protein